LGVQAQQDNQALLDELNKQKKQSKDVVETHSIVYFATGVISASVI
jgi:hypothetical protein